MKSLVLELRQEATNSHVKTTDLLRKALVVATKLEIQEFKKWIKQELDGYKKSTPEYRHVKGEIKAFNSYQGWIPAIFQNSKMAENLSSRNIGQAVSELEDLINKPDSKGMFTISISHDLLLKIFPDAMQLGIVPMLVIGKAQIVGIIDAVRNIILEWSLKLEKDGILGEGLTFTNEEKAKASSINYNIQNFSGILGNVTSENIQIGDYNMIHSQLKAQGVSQKERNDLENILDKLKKPETKNKKSFIKRGKEWLKRNSPIIGPTLLELIKKWIENAS